MELDGKFPTRRAAAAIAFAEHFMGRPDGRAELERVLSAAEDIAAERRSGVLGFNHLMMACGVPWPPRRPKPVQDAGRPASQGAGTEPG